MTRHTYTIPLALAFLASCTGTETGNPFSHELGVAGRTTDASVAALGTSEGGAAIDAAWMGLGEVALFPAGACGDDSAAETVVPGPVAVELVEGLAPSGVDLGHTGYCRVEVVLLPASPPLPVGAPAELGGSTVVVEGRRPDGTPFEIVSEASPVLEVRGAMDRFDAHEAMVVSLDFARWLEGVDLAGAVVSPDGTVRVNAVDNHDLLGVFDANLTSSLAIHRDGDADGHVGHDDEVLAGHP